MPRNNMVHRIDENQPTIVEALEAVGASVQTLGGKGVPDLLVGFDGKNYLLEVKPSKKSLNDDQEQWHSKWVGQVVVVRTVAEAFNAIGLEYVAAEDSSWS